MTKCINFAVVVGSVFIWYSVRIRVIKVNNPTEESWFLQLLALK